MSTQGASRRAESAPHPLPQAARDRWLSLDGRWEIVLEADSAARTITVPYAFEAALSGIGAGDETHEQVTYRRTFRVPESWAGGRVLLRFGGVDWRAAVHVDGEVVGTHEGGYAHFSFDLGALEPGTEHELVVHVDDPADDAAGQPKGKQRGSGGIWYTRTTGIWRSVWLEPVPDEYIVDASLRVDVDGTVTAAPGVSVEVIGLAGPPRLWSPDDPFLYDVELRLGDDLVRSYVGFRSIARNGRELLLNGEPLRIAGVLDQGFWPDGGYTAPSASALRADVEAAKALGFNLARKHVKVEDPRWYAWCDRLGLLVAQDLPSSHDLSSVSAREGLQREWLEIVEQLSGHPSIVLWIPINEDWGEPPPQFQRSLVSETRLADPTRLVIDASGWKQLEDTDLVDVHDYGRALTQHAGRREDIPLWFGEVGGLSIGTGDFVYRHVRDLADGYRRLVEQIPADVAGFVWTQLTDVEGEQNGLLTHDRVHKTDGAVIRAANEAFRRSA
ncbi:MAG TPA: glycoside hydrolase family 2 TIM barrel-domain containing protein [Gaiellaceae bacterium]|nr:glycoside hydrolase family 2 TIM barrel-domain containing protein [Gaiellaceae bacterium]